MNLSFIEFPRNQLQKFCSWRCRMLAPPPPSAVSEACHAIKPTTEMMLKLYFLLPFYHISDMLQSWSSSESYLRSVKRDEDRSKHLTFIGLCVANIVSEYKQQDATFLNLFISNIYWTVHHCNSWRMKDQLDVTCYFISLLMCSTCFGH